MDTDPDTAPEGWSSQETSEAYSEEEQWVYSNGNGMGDDENDDETNENNISLNMANLSMVVHCNDNISIDVVDGANAQQVSALPHCIPAIMRTVYYILISIT